MASIARHSLPSILDEAARREDARWSDAVGLTILLWLFVLVLYLPVIAERHAGEGVRSVALDSATIFVSMVFALPLFATFRATLGWATLPRVVVLVVVLTLTAVSQALFDLAWTAWVSHALERMWASLPVDFRRGYGAMINYLSVFGVNLALFQFATTRRRARRQERRYAAALASGQQAELEALRFRLNPHFLFNTLNAISAMIVTRRTDEADQTVERLAAFLRASYAYDPMMLIPLEEELAAVEHYLRIEETRFGDRMTVSVRCEPGTDGVGVPPLMLQPLMEALIEAASQMHAREAAVRLWACRRADELLIEASLSPAPTEPLDTTGVQRVRHRLQALFGERAELRAVRGRLIARLPATLADAPVLE